eukprot:scaffold119130_cov33-Tisochrysis_lutea.AAC.2
MAADLADGPKGNRVARLEAEEKVKYAAEESRSRRPLVPAARLHARRREVRSGWLRDARTRCGRAGRTAAAHTRKPTR